MSATLSKSDAIKWLISVALAAVFLVIPTGDVYTYQVKMFMVITVLFLALIAFEVIDSVVCGILMPACWILFKVAEAKVVMSPWLGSTVLMIVGALFLGATLDDCGLLKRISYFIMCKVKGKYFMLLLSIALTGIIINILTSGRGYLVLAPLAFGLCVSLDCLKTRLGAGIAMAVFVGGCTSHSFTYQATGWAVLNKMGADYLPANAITPANIMFYDLPLLFVALLILYIVSKWYKPDKELGEITYFEEKLKEMGPISREEKWNALMLAILVVFIFTVSWHKLDINLGFAIIPWLVYLPGVNAATSDTIKKVNFPIVFFVMACMGIGVVASSLGLGQVFTAWIKMALNGSTSPFAIIAIIFAIVFALNFLMTPMAIFALIVAPVLALVTEMGFNAVPFALAINACSEAILFPYEYVPYLIVFAFGMISMKDFIKLNIMRSVVFFGGFLALLVPWWMLIGLL